MTEQLPPELQHQVMKLQQLQDQLVRVSQERSIVEAELREVERVLKVLGDLPENSTVYRSVGSVLVKVEKKQVEQEYGDRKEILEIRLNKLKEQENLLKEQIKKVQEKIRELSSKNYLVGTGGKGA